MPTGEQAGISEQRRAPETAESTDAPERRYGGRTAAERRADRRERLLDAGLDQFSEQGYGATSIEGLCAAASLNARYFYEQFRTREDLLAAVYERHADDVLAHVRAALDSTSTDEPALRSEAALRAFVEATLADERAARVKYYEMVAVSPELHGIRRRTARRYADLIVREAPWLTEGGRSPEQARQIAVSLVGATDGLILDWMAGDRAAPVGSIVDTLRLAFGALLS